MTDTSYINILGKIDNISIPRPGDIGFDIRSSESLTIKTGETKAVDTGVIVAPSSNRLYTLVLSRSGLATKGIFVVNSPGLIDPSYRGERDTIRVILHNLGREDFQIKEGDRIAQLIFLQNIEVMLHLGGEIKEESRGGLGSTGVE